MLTIEKIKLLNIWKVNLFGEFSVSEVMSLSKKETKTWVFNALKIFVRYNIINCRIKGNINLYTLNINNPLALHLLQFLEVQESINFQKIKLISKIIENIPIKNCSILIFGSYANKKQSPDSDLDVCFLVENKLTEKKLKPRVNEIKLNHKIKIDDNYIIFEDFIQMLTNKEENLGKQIFRKHKLFYNPDIYYELIKEAYKRGFRP